MLLINGGLFEEGLPIALETIRLCQEHGNKRLLNHMINLQSFLEHQAFQASKTAATLGDALYGSFDL